MKVFVVTINCGLVPRSGTADVSSGSLGSSLLLYCSLSWVSTGPFPRKGMRSHHSRRNTGNPGLVANITYSSEEWRSHFLSQIIAGLDHLLWRGYCSIPSLETWNSPQQFSTWWCPFPSLHYPATFVFSFSSLHFHHVCPVSFDRVQEWW